MMKCKHCGHEIIGDDNTNGMEGRDDYIMKYFHVVKPYKNPYVDYSIHELDTTHHICDCGCTNPEPIE